MSSNQTPESDKILNWQVHLLIREGVFQQISESKKLNITQEMLDEAREKAKAELEQLIRFKQIEELESFPQFWR